MTFYAVMHWLMYTSCRLKPYNSRRVPFDLPMLNFKNHTLENITVPSPGNIDRTELSCRSCAKTGITQSKNDSSHFLLTSRVCALGAARLGRGLQRSFTGIWGIRLHVWLLIVMVRIRENPVLLNCPASHHFHSSLNKNCVIPLCNTRNKGS